MKTVKIAISGAALLLPGLLVAPGAEAHNWGCWRQPNRTVYTYNTASRRSQASAAINEWSNDTILNLPQISSHTDISVFDGNYGNTGWGGLASIESASGCTILHGHARVNLYYGYSSNATRGVFCQEVGHLFGLDHSNDGGCMGGGYFYDIGVSPHYTVVSHNISDISAKYSGTPLAPETQDADDPDRPRLIATWHQRPATLSDAVRAASAVVVARVRSVADGPDLVVPVQGIENDEDRIPTQRVSFDVQRVFQGRIGRSFELFQTGNAQFIMDEDPLYAQGETYVLFLTARGDGTYRVVSPDGRIKVTGRGLRATAHQGFATLLNGASLEALSSDLSQLRRGRR